MISHNRALGLVPLPVVLFVLILLAVGGCTDDHAAAGGGKRSPSIAASDAWGRRMDSLIGLGRFQAIDDAFDRAVLFDRIVRGIDVDESDRKEFLDGPDYLHYGENIRTSLKDGGSFSFVHLTSRDGHVAALFRFNFADGKIAYNELLLEQGGDGAPKIVDIYNYSSGQLVSEQVRRIVLGSTTSALARLIEGDDDETTMKVLDSLGAYQARHDYSGGLRYFDALPEEMKNERVVLVERVALASELEDTAAYDIVLQDVQRRAGGDASIDLLMIDHFYMQQQYDSLAATIERLDSALGGDPYLDFYRGLTAMVRGDFAAARVYATKLRASRAAGDKVDALELSIELKAHDNAGIARVLDTLAARGEAVTRADIESDSTLQDFIASREYAAYLKRHPK